jgi:predicted component of type VI protein secretion system
VDVAHEVHKHGFALVELAAQSIVSFDDGLHHRVYPLELVAARAWVGGPLLHQLQGHEVLVGLIAKLPDHTPQPDPEQRHLLGHLPELIPCRR